MLNIFQYLSFCYRSTILYFCIMVFYLKLFCLQQTIKKTHRYFICRPTYKKHHLETPLLVYRIHTISHFLILELNNSISVQECKETQTFHGGYG